MLVLQSIARSFTNVSQMFQKFAAWKSGRICIRIFFFQTVLGFANKFGFERISSDHFDI
jgi:hypothetical protein